MIASRETHVASDAEALTFIIRPETTDVPLGVFVRSIGDIRKLVHQVDYAVTHERYGRIWVVSEIHSSNPTITIRPLIDSSGVVSTIASGLVQLTARETLDPPRHFSADALDELKKMRRLFVGRERARRIEVFTNGGPVVTIDEGIAETVDRVLRGGYTALGSIEGSLDAINLHRNPVATIWDRLTGAPIRCYLPVDPLTKARIKDLLEKRVLISGLVRYFRNGVPQMISQVTAIREIGPDPSAPRGDFGSVPGITDGEDSVRYVHSRRE